MGSDSDLPVVEKCINELKKYEIPTEVHVYSAHRTPVEAIEFAQNAEKNGFGVLISAAGKAAHLGGVIAANTVLPVIGIPIKASALEGVDALLSTVQMPPGIPVAAVTVGKAGGKNAALYAIAILALSDPVLAERLREYRADQREMVLTADAELQEELKER